MARKADPTKKVRIIEAATRVFAKNGFNGTLMAQVAHAAEIGKGTIYEYFRSKEALFFAVFEHLMTETGSHMQSIAASKEGSIAQRLRALSDALISMWLPRLDLYSLVMEFWSATATLPSRQQFKQAFQDGYDAFRTLVADQIRSGFDSGEFCAPVDAEKIASAVIGTWDALLMQAWLDSNFDPRSVGQEHMNLIIRGLTSQNPSGDQ